MFDGAAAGGYPRLAGGDGLAVAPAVGAFGQALAVAFYFADVGFAFVGMGGAGVDGGAGGDWTDDAAKLLGRLAHAGGDPAQRHLPVAPGSGVGGVVAADGDHRLGYCW
jgi:hypothetical protein